MNRDMSASAFNPEFAFENVNMRLATNEGNTMMSWVNERGTKEMVLHIDTKPWETESSDSKYESIIKGTVIGTAVINHKLVLFTTDGTGSTTCDSIYVLEISKDNRYDLTGMVLFRGNIGLDKKYPIETLVSYESENIQKVYWTDNKNQPRVVNIVPSRSTETGYYNNNSFDFIQELQLKEWVTVSKMYGSGEFPAGVIQYAFTYYNKYRQETNIFYTTPLYYISYSDRGGAPDDKIANSFKIVVSNLDNNFEYLRIYSILRTSKDGTPFTKRVQDIEIIGKDFVTFIDNGLLGESIDPTELLYKGGDEIIVKTMEQKDGTLFLGNITTKKFPLEIKSTILSQNGVSEENPLANDNVSCHAVRRSYSLVSSPPFTYLNTLDGIGYDGASSFKAGEYYRLGVQFQYKNGKWSEPCWIGDKQCYAFPSNEKESLRLLSVPQFTYVLKDVFSQLFSQGYRRVRPVFAVPNSQGKTIICQGIGAPTVCRFTDRENTFTDQKETLYGSASWLFRTPIYDKGEDYKLPNALYQYKQGGYVLWNGTSNLNEHFIIPYQKKFLSSKLSVLAPYYNSTEIMGFSGFSGFGETDFNIDDLLFTINSPDIEFNEELHSSAYGDCSIFRIGKTIFEKTYGDIDIQTSSSPIGTSSGGFIHKSIETLGFAALISGEYYNDYIVDDTSEAPTYGPYKEGSENAINFPVYMWHKNGSLNNDVTRGGRSAVLLKKRISNYRLGGLSTYYPIWRTEADYNMNVYDAQLFSSDDLSIIKVNGHTYMGNMDKMLVPGPSPYYYTRTTIGWDNTRTITLYKIGVSDDTNTTGTPLGIWRLDTNSDNKAAWTQISTEVGNYVKGLALWREGISMKYKSTPHIVAQMPPAAGTGKNIYKDLSTGEVQLLEVVRPYDKDKFFGGTSEEVLKELSWIPCGPPRSFTADTKHVGIDFKWGDSYFQRWECLKTYPYTSEDVNQVIEIASFMVETRVNIDGRYDRNRSQTSNLNATPRNFNLINPVYSQMNNFFSYKMLDSDAYKNVDYPNTITWTKAKESGASVDLWTNITLASTLELDGNKGEINKLTRFNNQLLAFQDGGISQVLYNEQTQITTTEGVPLEISNSEKVQGKRYFSDTVGCSNKWSIVQTPSGIYFMDSNDKSIYLFNGQLVNLSTQGGFNAWAKQNIPSSSVEWNPEDFDNFVAYYDRLNQDVLFVGKDTVLAYSEKFNCFTSFYDYEGASYLNSIDDVEIWVKGNKLWKHQAGNYCNFFGIDKPFSMTLIGNQEPQVDKMFTNMEFRACVEGEGTYEQSSGKFSSLLPFDTLEVWNEYQHGLLALTNRDSNYKFNHSHTEGEAFLNRKFRMWRCDIPRDNAPVDSTTENKMGIKRFKARPLDRIRNPWAYLKLKKDKSEGKTEVHDIMVSYFG